MQQKTASRSAYRLFSFALLVSLLFSSFRVDTISPVRAQEASTETPTPAAIATPQPGVTILASDKSSKPIASQFIIRFTGNASENDKKAFVHAHGGSVVQRIDALNIIVIHLPNNAQGQPSPRSSIVESIEQDYYIDVLDDMVPPNDPRYAEQWALPAIGAPSAWAQMPSDTPAVTVAVVDSGICASHPDLAGRTVGGWDFLESDAVPQDDFGHGCSVSGVIAANMNNGIGIAGVAPNAQIMPLRVLNASGVGSYSDVAAAIVYAADNGAQVINLSLGGSNPSSTLENAVNYAISKGVIVVAAAGNNGTEGALYPAAYPDVIAVGSVDPNLEPSSFSNYGSQIDIWAPGRDILTTKRDGSYVLASGTSFAAPYVAGAEAMVAASGRIFPSSGELLLIGHSVYEIITPTSTEISSTSLPPPLTSIYAGRQRFSPMGIEVDIPLDWFVNEYQNVGLGFSFFTPDISLQEPDYVLEGAYIGVSLSDTTEDPRKLTPAEDTKSVIVDNWPGAWYQTLNSFSTVTTTVDVYKNDRLYRFILQHNNDDVNAGAYQLTFNSLLSTLVFIPQDGMLPLKAVPATIQDLAHTALAFPFDAGPEWQISSGGGYNNGNLHGGTNYGYAYYAFDFLPVNSGLLDSVLSLAPTSGTLDHPHTGYDSQGQAYSHCVDISIEHLDTQRDLWLEICHLDFESYQNQGSTITKAEVLGRLASDGCGGTCTTRHIHMAAFIGVKGNPWLSPSTRQALPYTSDNNLTLSNRSFPDSGGFNQYANTKGLYSTIGPVCALTLSSDTASQDICGGGTPPPNPTPPPGTIDGLKLISVSSPTVQKGQTFSVSIKYEVVSGQLLQSRGDHLFGFDPTYGAWPVQAVNGTINPGQQVTFTFNLTAPQQTGTFESKWQLKVGGNLVGPQAIIRFAVQDTSPPPTNSGPWNSQAWQNKYLAGYPNWEGQWTWSDNYPYVYFNWGTGAPFGWGGNEFSMRLWKTIHFPGGYYSFHTTHDDGVKVYLDNTVILDAWWDGSGGHDIGKNIPAGDHEVKVEYYENQGDANVNVYWYGPGFPEPDTNPPDGRITSPANNSATAAVPLTITANASDDVSGVNRVEFYANYCDGSCGWRLISTDYSLPYSTNWDWSSLADQHVQLTTHMIDNTGKVRMDPGGYIEVDLDRMKPVVSITSPTDGASLNGDPITITASASDNLSGVWKLEFFAGYNDASGTGAQSIFESPSPALLGASGELSSAEVSALGWHVVGWDENGSDGWSLNWTPSDVPDQSGISIFIYAYDHAGNYQGAIRSNLTLSRQGPVNILFNGGFEEGTTLPSRWSQDAWTPSYSTFIWDTDQKHSGSRSIKIANSYNNDARWIQTVYVQPNSNYRLSGWIKTQIVAHSPDSRDVGANLSVMGNLEYTNGLIGTNDWTYVSLSFNTGDRTQIDVGARLGMYSGTTTGIAWFDDLKLELLSTPTCYTLTKNVNPSGSIAASPAPNCSNGTKYIHGTVVKLTATPAAGYAFGNWSGAVTGSTNPIYVTMTGNKSVTANFVQTALQSFGDVSPGYWAQDFIERLYAAGITGGCGASPLRYCPETTVTRSQMAVFLLRGIYNASYGPPGVGGSTGFGDVPTNYWAAAWIKQLAAEGITAGCGANTFCPEGAVTRAQMAVFLLRAKYGVGYTPPSVGVGTGFIDVAPTYWSAAWIKQLAAEGITGGCGAGNYCPESPVTRAQMAVFLVRTFNLP
jgi:thermitase